MIEQENLDLIQQITRLQQNCSAAQSKINELTNTQNINKKFLFEEEKERDEQAIKNLSILLKYISFLICV